jgi:hypothetical protein
MKLTCQGGGRLHCHEKLYREEWRREDAGGTQMLAEVLRLLAPRAAIRVNSCILPPPLLL